MLMLSLAAIFAAQPAAVVADTITSKGALRDAVAVARCVIAADRATATGLLETLPLAGAVRAEGRQIVASTGCARGAGAGESALQLRGALAQELYFTDFREFGVAPRNRGSWARLSIPVQSDETAATDEMSRLYVWSDCVVRNDTRNTERVLRSEIGSRQEASLLAGMEPYMRACLEQGQRINVSTGDLRSLFAQSAYVAAVRYWSGDIRQAARGGQTYASAADADQSDFVICKRFPVAGSRVRTRRWCMTKAEWQNASQAWRSWMHEATATGIQS